MFETEGLEPISGILKESPEDFFVEELPLYPASGEGEHFYIQIEKIGLSTPELVQNLSRLLNISQDAIGYAGLKDKNAQTQQFLSLTNIKEEALKKLDGQKHFKVLSVSRHHRKIRIGHLKGNRFRLKIRNIRPGDYERAQKMLERLERYGIPNAYGEQRFGRHENNYKLGRCLIKRDYHEFFQQMYPMSEIGNAIARKEYQQAHEMLPLHQKTERRVLQVLIRDPRALEKAVQMFPQRLRQLYISSYQSYLFNRFLQNRFPQRHQLQIGDVAMKHVNNACFIVESLDEQARYEANEISPTGPIFGYKMLRPKAGVLAMENQILDEAQLTLKDFKVGFGISQQGTRRPLRVIPQEVQLTNEKDGLLLQFVLPKGSYATTLFTQLLQKAPTQIAVESEETL